MDPELNFGILGSPPHQESVENVPKTKPNDVQVVSDVPKEAGHSTIEREEGQTMRLSRQLEMQMRRCIELEMTNSHLLGLQATREKEIEDAETENKKLSAELKIEQDRCQILEKQHNEMIDRVERLEGEIGTATTALKVLLESCEKKDSTVSSKIITNILSTTETRGRTRINTKGNNMIDRVKQMNLSLHECCEEVSAMVERVGEQQESLVTELNAAKDKVVQYETQLDRVNCELLRLKQLEVASNGLDSPSVLREEDTTAVAFTSFIGEVHNSINECVDALKLFEVGVDKDSLPLTSTTKETKASAGVEASAVAFSRRVFEVRPEFSSWNSIKNYVEQSSGRAALTELLNPAPPSLTSSPLAKPKLNHTQSKGQVGQTDTTINSMIEEVNVCVEDSVGEATLRLKHLLNTLAEGYMREKKNTDILLAAGGKLMREQTALRTELGIQVRRTQDLTNELHTAIQATTEHNALQQSYKEQGETLTNTRGTVEALTRFYGECVVPWLKEELALLRDKQMAQQSYLDNTLRIVCYSFDSFAKQTKANSAKARILKGELDESRQLVTELQEQIAAVEDRGMDVEELHRLRIEVEDKDEMVRRLTEEVTELKIKLDGSESRQNVQSMQVGSVDMYKEENEHQRKQIRRLTTDCQALKDELVKVISAFKEIKSKYEQSKSSVHSFKT